MFPDVNWVLLESNGIGFVICVSGFVSREWVTRDTDLCDFSFIKMHCFKRCLMVFSRVLRDSTPRYVGPLVGPLVPFLLFRRFLAFCTYSSCPDALVTFSSTAPAHPHATRVAVYPALLI